MAEVTGGSGDCATGRADRLLRGVLGHFSSWGLAANSSDAGTAARFSVDIRVGRRLSCVPWATGARSARGGQVMTARYSEFADSERRWAFARADITKGVSLPAAS
jgi:hypothetical protein